MKVSLSLGALALVSFAGDVVGTDITAAVDAVTVDFLGASGGMKIYDNRNQSDWLMVQQDKLEEVTTISGQPNKLNMAGGDAAWTTLTKTTVDSVDTYTTTFSKSGPASSTFSLTAHISTGLVNITEPVPCSGCDSGDGHCTQTDAAGSVTCTQSDLTVDCAVGFEECVEYVIVPKDELKFSIQVHNWPFKSAASTLKYAIVLKQKNAGGTVKESGSTTKQFEIGDGGKLVLPTKGKIVGGGAGPEDIDVGISTEQKGSQFIINFEFPYFAAGKTLYYDPTMTPGEADAASSIGTSLIAGFVAVVAAALNARH